MKILMLSYIQLEKEGRCQRCFNELKKHNDVFLIDAGKETLNESGRLTVKLTKSGFQGYFQFCAAVKKAVRNIDFDVIYAHNYYCAQAAVKLGRKYNKPVIYDAYELYYPAAKRAFSMRDKFFYMQEKKIMNSGADIIAASYERALIMLGHYNLKKIPYVIKNMPYSFEGVRIEKKDKSDDKIKIVYAGFVSKDRSILSLIDAIKRCELRDKIELDIYGGGPLEKELSEMNVDFMTYHGKYNNSELETILKKYDIGFISYLNHDLNNIFCCPNKVYDYICNGLVLIAPYNEGLDKIITSNKLGVCNDDLVFAITECANNYSIYRNNIEAFVNNLSESDNSITLKNIISRLEKN